MGKCHFKYCKYYYPHTSIGKVWIYRLLCVCVCVFIRLRIYLLRIKLVALNFALWFIGVLGRESPHFGELIPQKPKIRRVGQPPGSKLYSVKAYRKSKVYGVKAARPTINVTLEMRCSWNIARRVDVGSACVDIRPSRKTVFQQKSILIKNLLKR